MKNSEQAYERFKLATKIKMRKIKIDFPSKHDQSETGKSQKREFSLKDPHEEHPRPLVQAIGLILKHQHQKLKFFENKQNND